MLIPYLMKDLLISVSASGCPGFIGNSVICKYFKIIPWQNSIFHAINERIFSIPSLNSGNRIPIDGRITPLFTVQTVRKKKILKGDLTNGGSNYLPYRTQKIYKLFWWNSRHFAPSNLFILGAISKQDAVMNAQVWKGATTEEFKKDKEVDFCAFSFWPFSPIR